MLESNYLLIWLEGLMTSFLEQSSLLKSFSLLYPSFILNHDLKTRINYNPIHLLFLHNHIAPATPPADTRRMIRSTKAASWPPSKPSRCWSLSPYHRHYFTCLFDIINALTWAMGCLLILTVTTVMYTVTFQIITNANLRVTAKPGGTTERSRVFESSNH